MLRNAQGEGSEESSAATCCQTMHMQSRICTYACIYSDRRIGGEVFELCGCCRDLLDRRASSWQNGMKGLDGHCTGGKRDGVRPRAVIVVGRMAEPCGRVA